MEPESKDQFITCSCGISDHIMRFRSFFWIGNDGKPKGLDVCAEVLLNPNRSLADRIISGIKYIFCYKDDKSLFDEIILDDKNIDSIIDFLQDIKEKKKKYEF